MIGSPVLSVHPIPTRKPAYKSTPYTLVLRRGDDLFLHSFVCGGLCPAVVQRIARDAQADQILFILAGDRAHPSNDQMSRHVGPGGRPPSKARVYTLISRKGNACVMHEVRYGGTIDEVSPLLEAGCVPIVALLNRIRDIRGLTSIEFVEGMDAKKRMNLSRANKFMLEVFPMGPAADAGRTNFQAILADDFANVDIAFEFSAPDDFLRRPPHDIANDIADTDPRVEAIIDRLLLHKRYPLFLNSRSVRVNFAALETRRGFSTDITRRIAP